MSDDGQAIDAVARALYETAAREVEGDWAVWEALTDEERAAPLLAGGVALDALRAFDDTIPTVYLTLSSTGADGITGTWRADEAEPPLTVAVMGDTQAVASLLAFVAEVRAAARTQVGEWCDEHGLVNLGVPWSWDYNDAHPGPCGRPLLPVFVTP